MVEQRSLEEKISDIISEYGEEIPNGFHPVVAIVKDGEPLVEEPLVKESLADNPAATKEMVTSARFACPTGYVRAFNGFYYYCKKA